MPYLSFLKRAVSVEGMAYVFNRCRDVDFFIAMKSGGIDRSWYF